jgi:uncharacterized protein (TIGR04255 family)
MFNLERPPHYRLTRPPLAEALAQVVYPVRTQLQSVNGIAPIQKRLEDLFPYMVQEQVQQVSLLMGPTGPSAAESRSGNQWKFTDDLGWMLLVSVDTATLSVGPEYGHFGEFSTRFRRILDALGEDAGVARCDRLGLRYVDVAETPPGDEGAWREWFRPDITGWPATDIVSPTAKVITSITQTQLSVPPVGELSGPPAEIAGVIRHGYVPANTILPGVSRVSALQNGAFLLDVDIYVAATQPFDPEALVEQITMFHDQLDRFFHWTLTAAGELYFGLEELE